VSSRRVLESAKNAKISLTKEFKIAIAASCVWEHERKENIIDKRVQNCVSEELNKWLTFFIPSKLMSVLGQLFLLAFNCGLKFGRHIII